MAHLDVQLVDPDGQVGVRVQVQVIDGLLDAVEDLGEHLMLVHAGFKRTHLQINLLLQQKKIIHLRGKYPQVNMPFTSPFTLTVNAAFTLPLYLCFYKE